MTIFADNREQIEIPDDFEVIDDPGLPAGDYAVEGYDHRGEDVKYLFERKEWAELVNSFRSGQIFNQLGRMLEQDHIPFLIIEGNRNDAYTYANARRGQVRRFLSSIMIKMDVRTYQSNAPSDSHNFIRDTHDWLHDDRKRAHSVRETEKVPDEVRPQYIMEGFPGVGPKTAQDILEEIDTVYNVVTATKDELMEIDGVGPKTAGGIHDSVRLNWNEI